MHRQGANLKQEPEQRRDLKKKKIPELEPLPVGVSNEGFSVTRTSETKTFTPEMTAVVLKVEPQ